jgi:hypothetical protein
MRSRVFAVAGLFSMLVAMPAAAQDSDGLAGLLLRFFSPSNPVVLRDAPAPFSHAAHFVSQPNAQAILRELNRDIATQISTFPLGSSSPGFTYTFDPALGVFNRSAESFGPVFSERPLTAGKGKLSFGVSHQRATYDTIEGKNLRDGEIQLYLTHLDTNGDNSTNAPWFEGDLIRADLSMDLKTQTTVLVANYGLGNHLDLGVAVPIQQVDISAQIMTTLERLSTAADAPALVLHIFPDGSDSHTFLESGKKSGLGDVVVRSKYNFMSKPNLGMAAGLDLRLPTGDENNLLGSGATQAKLYLIVGGAAKKFSPRATGGYTFSSGGSDFTGDLPNELGYSAGFDFAVHPRATFTADLLGRTLFDTGRIVEQDHSFDYTLRADPTKVLTTTRTTVVADTGNLNLLFGTANLKVNIAGHFLVNAGAIFGLGEAGLKDKVTPVFGIDYSF